MIPALSLTGPNPATNSCPSIDRNSKELQGAYKVIDEALKRYRAQSHGCPTQKAAPTFAGRHNPEDVRKCLLSLAGEKNPSSMFGARRVG
jgi:hypothetical protein